MMLVRSWQFSLNLASQTSEVIIELWFDFNRNEVITQVKNINEL